MFKRKGHGIEEMGFSDVCIEEMILHGNIYNWKECLKC